MQVFLVSYMELALPIRYMVIDNGLLNRVVTTLFIVALLFTIKSTKNIVQESTDYISCKLCSK